MAGMGVCLMTREIMWMIWTVMMWVMWPGWGASSAMQLLTQRIAVSEFLLLRNSMIVTYVDVGSMMSVTGEYHE